MPDRADRIERRGPKFVVLSKSGEVLGEHDTEAEADAEAGKNDAAGTEWRWHAAELRLDLAEPPTAEGWRRVPAVIGRGDVVLPYRNADGSIRLEFRPASEVTDPASVASFEGLPVTNDHPPVHLDSATARQFALGSSATARAEGSDLVSNVLLTDDSILADVESGKRQISPGYRVRFDPRPGVFRGQRYDGVQRDIRGNHIAVVNRGRQGPTVSLRMDSGDRVAITTEEGHVPGERNDAFVKRVGSRWVVFQGNTGKQLTTWLSESDAIKERDRLHRKNNPSAANRGASARTKTAEREEDHMADAENKTDDKTTRADELKSAIDELKAKDDALEVAEAKRADTEAQIVSLKAKVDALTAALPPKVDVGARVDALEAAHAKTLKENDARYRADLSSLEERLDAVATAKSIVPGFEASRIDAKGNTVPKTRSEVRIDVIGVVLVISGTQLGT